jgi:hypothetical protein
MKVRSFLWFFVFAALFGCDRGAPERPRSTTIAIGQTITGQLSEEDWTDVFADRSYTDLYDIILEAGQQITVDLSSDEFDTYLSILRGPGDQLVDNDDIDPGQDTNSRVTYRAPARIGVFIAVTTFQPGQIGRYRLQVREGPTAESGSSTPGESENPPVKNEQAADAATASTRQ